jgi:hypothetical protein
MMLSTKPFAVFAAILGLTLTFLVSSGAAQHKKETQARAIQVFRSFWRGQSQHDRRCHSNANCQGLRKGAANSARGESGP